MTARWDPTPGVVAYDRLRIHPQWSSQFEVHRSDCQRVCVGKLNPCKGTIEPGDVYVKFIGPSIGLQGACYCGHCAVGGEIALGSME